MIAGASVTLPHFGNSENVGITPLPSSVPRCSFFHQKPDLAFLGRWWGHELPHRLVNNPKLGIVFLFQSSELSGQIFVGSKHQAQADKSPHDFYVDLNRPLAPKHAREHGHALFGENIREISPASATL
jgi:hypothetical protein